MFAALTTIGVSAVEFNTSYYKYNGEVGVTIIGFNGLNGGETVVIPPEIDGKPVLAIVLDGVVTTTRVPGAEYIGRLDLTQADNLKFILPDAFICCPNITGVIQSNTVEIVEDSAFYDCDGLTSMYLPALETVGEQAFKLCTGLTSMYLPALKTVGEWAFNGCTGLTSVYLKEVTMVEYCAFLDCSKLTFVWLAKDCKIYIHAFMGTPLAEYYWYKYTSA